MGPFIWVLQACQDKSNVLYRLIACCLIFATDWPYLLLTRQWELVWKGWGESEEVCLLSRRRLKDELIVPLPHSHRLPRPTPRAQESDVSIQNVTPRVRCGLTDYNSGIHKEVASGLRGITISHLMRTKPKCQIWRLEGCCITPVHRKDTMSFVVNPQNQFGIGISVHFKLSHIYFQYHTRSEG